MNPVWFIFFRWLKPLTSIAIKWQGKMPGSLIHLFFSSFNTSQIFQVKINLAIFSCRRKGPRRVVIPHLFVSDYLKATNSETQIKWPTVDSSDNLNQFGKWYNLSKNWSFFASKTLRRFWFDREDAPEDARASVQVTLNESYTHKPMFYIYIYIMTCLVQVDLQTSFFCIFKHPSTFIMLWRGMIGCHGCPNQSTAIPLQEENEKRYRQQLSMMFAGYLLWCNCRDCDPCPLKCKALLYMVLYAYIYRII